MRSGRTFTENGEGEKKKEREEMGEEQRRPLLVPVGPGPQTPRPVTARRATYIEGGL